MLAFRFNNNEIVCSVEAPVERTKVGVLLRPQKSTELSHEEKEPRVAIEEQINQETRDIGFGW